jgi:Phosphotransferase enzyme family
MPGSSQRTRGALAALADPEQVARLLDAWLTQRGRTAAGPWRREYARYHPGQDPWAVCLYESRDGSLLRIDALPSAERAALVHPTIGPLRITEFPDDAALPGLSAVMAMLESAQIVRYRPGKRCTLRGFAAGGERFVKVVPGGERIYEEALKLWEIFKGSAFSLSVAEPYGWHAPTSSFWQGVLPGRPVHAEAFGADGERFAYRLAAALGELATSPLEPSLLNSATHHLQRTSQTIARAALALPALEPRFAQLRLELERRHAALGERRLVPVHGAPNLHRWLVQGSRLGLVSFDRLALGDPEFDLATLVADLDSDRAPQRPVAAIEAALIAGYESKGLRIDLQRLRLYRAHKRALAMVRTAWAVPPDAPDSAEHQLRSVEALLEQS